MELKLGGKRKGTAIVSAEDYDRLSKHGWSINVRGYVAAMINGKTTSLHHFIMNVTDGRTIDHINGVPTDNRRENLRLSCEIKNGQNKRVHKNKTSSKYRGVYGTPNGQYKVYIIIEGVKHYLGTHDTELDAVDAWEMFVVHSKLDHIQLHFPEKRDEYLSREYKPYQKKKPISEYTGLSKSRGSYEVHVSTNGGKIYIGISNDPIKAAQMYDDYVVKHKILGKELNFPERHPTYCDQLPIFTKCEDIDDNTVKLLITSDKNRVVMIDKQDYDKVKHYHCTIGNKGYVFAKVGTKEIRLHRLLCEVTDPKIFIDHIDNNPLNNKMNNLRISDSNKNPKNRKKKKGTSSDYIGVTYDRKQKIWRTSLMRNGKFIRLLSSSNEELCARSRDLYILENCPDDHYKLNFEWTPEEISTWTKLIEAAKRKFTSSYIGVCFQKKSNKWVSSVKYKDKLVFNKLYNTEQEAARARDLYIKLNLLNVEYKMNFEWTTKDIAKWKKLLNFQ